jgi:hypothetical protein
LIHPIVNHSSAAAMSTLRVLLINQYFPPDTAATAKIAALVAGAIAKRHRVTVLAGRPSYDPTERHPVYLLRRQQVGGMVVKRVPSRRAPDFGRTLVAGNRVYPAIGAARQQ